MRVITQKSEFLLRLLRNHFLFHLLVTLFSIHQVFFGESHPDVLSLERGGLSGSMLAVQRTGTDRDCLKPKYLISLTCNVTMNSEIGPKSCACSRRATAIGKKFPQPAPTCDKVIVRQAQAGIGAASFCGHTHFCVDSQQNVTMCAWANAVTCWYL